MFRLLSWIYDLIYKLFDFLWNLGYKRSAETIRATARTDAHAAVLERARLKRKRGVIKSIYSILVILLFGVPTICILVLWKDNDNLLKYVWAIVLAIPALETLYALLFERTGNLSLFEATDVVGKCNIYALYLRAFKADQRRVIFKEEDLVRSLLQQHVVTFAVGLPEEIDSSPGALRVYINNDTWQEEVRMLMDSASYLFLRICYTDPCVWEVQQALSLSKELYIIIDNAEDYSKVLNKCPGLPQNVTLAPGKYVIYRRLENGSWKNVSPAESDTPTYDKSSFNRSFVTSLLERFPKLDEDASIELYEESIEGLYTNMIAGADHALKIRVASRIMDLLEDYCKKEDSDGRVTHNAQRYLQMFERFNPLPEGLQSRKDDLVHFFSSSKES